MGTSLLSGFRAKFRARVYLQSGHSSLVDLASSPGLGLGFKDLAVYGLRGLGVYGLGGKGLRVQGFGFEGWGRSRITLNPKP